MSSFVYYKQSLRYNAASWNSVAGITTDYGLDRGVGVRVPVGSRIFTFACRPERNWGPPSSLSDGYSFPGVKLLGRESDHTSN
jgi:hypothetical protein